ncbi:hypothetical protein LEP1GSC175_1950 [Leptospira santarosai str. HAI821]|nr:hypothetical protein LEP1GSC071_0307 [Leptospira santarosai str. JET]EMM78245.1 hypothetical protein LEP1GSC040_1774 [Leptospira santarosai str. 2000030832]EMO33296.1 hypothetical protein LEP1GSC175_1950 [Leptospira santarosai str. HAI821]EMO86126.1 hypothetical protein LEP1GSC070_0250 [Leptospira santarosai str. AIM]
MPSKTIFSQSDYILKISVSFKVKKGRTLSFLRKFRSDSPNLSQFRSRIGWFFSNMAT